MFVQPDGPGYEFPLLGEIISTPPPIPAALAPVIPASQPLPLLCNKHTLHWTGVNIGDAV